MPAVLAKLLIPAVVIGFVALASKPAGAKQSGAAAAKPGAGQMPPPDVMGKIAAAFQAADPAQLRKVADEVEAQGFKAQADDLRAFAKKIESEIASSPVVKPPTSPTLPPAVPGALPILPAQQQEPILPGIVPPIASTKPSAPTPSVVLPEQVIQATGPTQAQRVLAGKMALMLRHNPTKGREDKTLVTAFQQQELDAGHAPGGAFGSVGSKADGLYGPKTALSLARHYAIVPPKPLYWSAANWLNDKKNYRTEMARFASIDPQRADEWSAASRVL